MTSSDTSYDRQARAAKNQSLFREINERVKDLNDAFEGLTHSGEWICECANNQCVEKLAMSSEEYEAIRKEGTHFFVAPSDKHVWPDVERVITRNERYWVVEKVGLGGRMAEQVDPRSKGPLRFRS